MNVLLNRKSRILRLEYVWNRVLFWKILSRRSHHSYYYYCYYYIAYLCRSLVILYICSPRFLICFRQWPIVHIFFKYYLLKIHHNLLMLPLASPEYSASQFHSASLRLITFRMAVKGSKRTQERPLHSSLFFIIMMSVYKSIRLTRQPNIGKFRKWIVFIYIIWLLLPFVSCCTYRLR